MRIAVLTDVHANLPALQAALDAIRREGCEAIYHTGDAIGIGPYPSECMDLLLNAADVRLLMGNHDAWFAHGLPEPRPPWMSDGEVVHQRWVHSRLDPSLRSVVARWPYVVQEQLEGIRVTFLHYAVADSADGFVPVLREANAGDLDATFAQYQADIVFYGHEHRASDITGRSRYVNPGSLGCHTEPVARFAILECTTACYRLEGHSVPYDDAPLFEAFEKRKVPEREFIYQAFFGGRYRHTWRQTEGRLS